MRAPPDFDGDRCVHGLSPFATCHACVDACPHGALVLGENSLGINEEACTGCGVCRPACPESAVETGSGHDTWLPLIDVREEEAYLACDRIGLPVGFGVVACVHGVLDGDLDDARTQRITTLLVAHPDCESCPDRPQERLQLEQRVGLLNALAKSAHELQIKLERLDISAWHRRRNAAAQRKNDLDHSRRRLFRAVVGGESSLAKSKDQARADKLLRFQPRIDSKSCVGCDACVRICPHAALVLERRPDALAYIAYGEHCTGCGLCADVCEPRAVAVVGMQQAQGSTVELTEGKCSKCGAAFHRPAGNTSASATVCHICNASNHAGRLFQVRS